MLLQSNTEYGKQESMEMEIRNPKSEIRNPIRNNFKINKEIRNPEIRKSGNPEIRKSGNPKSGNQIRNPKQKYYFQKGNLF